MKQLRYLAQWDHNISETLQTCEDHMRNQKATNYVYIATTGRELPFCVCHCRIGGGIPHRTLTTTEFPSYGAAYRFAEAQRQPIENFVCGTIRDQRQNIRNAHLCSSVADMELAKERQDKYGRIALDEMIDECRKHGVDNFGKTPAF